MSKDEFRGSILYELICCSQWVDEKEEHLPLNNVPEKIPSVISQIRPATFLSSKPTVFDAANWLLSLGPTWKFAVTPDGKFIGILQSGYFETRSDRDNFNSTFGKTPITKDVYPNFRCMAWNQDGTLLAVSLTNGQISFFDVMATQIFIVRLFPLPADDLSISFSVDNALTGLFFVEERVRKATYPNELVAIDRKGFIKAFRQTNADEMGLHHEFSLRRFYPKGTTAVTYSNTNSIILVCGILEVGGDVKSKEDNLSHGITAWRLLNDHPFYRIVFNVPHEEFRMDSRSLWRAAFSAISPSWNKTAEDAVFRVNLSPNGKFLASAHLSGSISIWHLPSLKLHQLWPLKSQFQYNAENTAFNTHWRVALNRSRSKQMDPWRFHPYDINWWNNEVLIIARANGCVSLCTILDHVPCKNLLGDLPEYFESPVNITSRYDKGFFAFEGDLRVKGPIKSVVSNSRNNLIIGGDDEDSLNSSTLQLNESSLADLNSSENQSSELLLANAANDTDFWVMTLYQEILFWLTDSERFRPPRKRRRKPPTWIETHRVINVRSITPLELFHRKIDAEEYGEALDLAKIYGLDSDLVFQRRWTRNPVTVRTIKDFLARITKRNWVLQECLERVPDNITAARQLLEFGLKGTDLTAAVTISQGRDKGRFILWAPDDLEISEDEYLSLIDRDNLEVKRLIGYRKKFLHFLDMLNTYETIVGGPFLAEDNFDSAVYTKLRNNSVLESCIDMARSSDISGLKIMLTNHWTDIEPYYLLVISSFPETTPPYSYRDFLPELTNGGQVLLWDEKSNKEKDWCDGFEMTDAHFGASSKTLVISEGQGELHSAEYVCHWYDCRVREIESLTGLINNALDLARLGVERNIDKMKTIMENLETLEILVYDIKIDEMTLEKLEKLSSSDKLEILMSATKEETFVNNFRTYALPFLDQCDRREPGSKFTLLNQYLTKLSQKDLKLTLKIFEQSKSDIVDPIISDISNVMKLAYNCIYACKSSKQSENILALLGCLPDRGYGHSNYNSFEEKENTKKELAKLHDSIDELELHYHAVQILEKYGMEYSLKEIQSMADDVEEISLFFERLCQGANKKNPPMKVNEWKSLLYDMLELQKKIFIKLESDKCFMTYVGALLRSGHTEIISLARNFLDQTPTEVETDEKGNLKVTRRNSSQYSTSFALYLYLIPYEESLGMILEAAEIYFDSASNYSDPDMELAKVCLNLMQNSKEPNITLMFDLIDAVKVLNKDFNLHVLPQSVRRSQEKIGLLRKAMENIEGGYKKIQQLLKLAMFLRIDDMDQEEVESCVFEMVGNSGLAELDIKFCTQICHNIMAKGYHAGWKVFTQVAKFQSDPPILDHETRLAFINYALNICPNDQIFHVLNAKYLIEIRSLQAQMTELSPSDSAVESAMLESQEQESIVHEQLNKTKFEEFVHTTTTWINPLKKMAEVVKTGSGAIMAVAKGQSHTHRQGGHSLPFKSPGAPRPEEEDEPNENFFRESYPTFYISEEEASSVHQSLLASKYNTFSSSTFSNFIKSNPALELCLTINRIWHLERLLLGDDEAGQRDDKVLEQLVGDILPEDIPWGLAILSSVDNFSVLSKILRSVPQTEISYNVILVYLAFRINEELRINKIEEDYAAWNLTKLVEDVDHLVKNEKMDKTEVERIYDLIELFQQFKDNRITAIPSVNYADSLPGSDSVYNPSLGPGAEGKDYKSESDDDFQDGDGWED